MDCIKCGATIPEGELFCEDCSLNQIKTKQDDLLGIHIPHPKGRMQTPKEKPLPITRMADYGKEDKRKPLRKALVVTIVLLLACLVFMAWQFMEIHYERQDMKTREASIAALETELQELHRYIEEKEKEYTNLQTTLADRQLKITELEGKLETADTDRTALQAKVDQLTRENEALKARIEAQKAQLQDLRDQLDDALKIG